MAGLHLIRHLLAVGAVAAATLAHAAALDAVCGSASTTAVGHSAQLCAPVWPSAATPPVQGDVVVITLYTSFPEGASVTAGSVNGQDVDGRVAPDPLHAAAFALSHATAAGDTLWPWRGLSVNLAFTLPTNGTDDATVLVSGVVVPGVNVTSSLPLGGAVAATPQAMCVGDVDGNGFDDVYLGAADGVPNQLWLSADGTAFTEAAAGWGVAATAFSTLDCAFTDVAPDALLDLALGTTAGLRVFVNGGESTMADATASRGVYSQGAVECVSVGDMDLDGTPDIYAGSAAGVPNAVWLNQQVMFVNAGTPSRLDVSERTVQAILADLDGDTDPELVLTDPDSGMYLLFLNNGAGSSSEAGPQRGFGLTTPAGHAYVADITSDGVLDLVVLPGDDVAAGLRVYVNDGTATFSLTQVAMGGSAATAVVLDVDLDGDVDLYLPDLATFWVNRGDGNATFASLGAAGAPPHLSVALDVDHDGDQDVLTGSMLLENHNARPAVANSITVRLLSPQGVPFEFGASVVVSCVSGCTPPSWAAVRVFDGGMAGPQGGYDAVVGVPSRSAVYNVTLTWAGSAELSQTLDWRTHPGLGHVVPHQLHQYWGGVLLVRTAALQAVSVVASPWDYAGVAARLGGAKRGPEPGETATVFVHLAEPVTGLRVPVGGAATVNGQNVAGTLAEATPGVYVLTYTTEVGDEEWPWRGLQVDVGLADSGGLSVSVSRRVVPGASFEESTTVLAPGFGGADSLTMCSHDVNRDGVVDMLVGGAAGFDNQLWVSDGGAFVSQATAWGVDALTSAAVTACAFFDANGDAWVDLLVAAHTGEAFLYLKTSPTTFTLSPLSGLAMAAGAGVNSVSVGDLNEDEWVDVYVSTDTVNYYFVNDGAGSFTERGAAAGVDFDQPSSNSVIIDIDHDGDGDLAVSCAVDGCKDVVYLNSGSGSFTASPDAGLGYDVNTAVLFAPLLYSSPRLDLCSIGADGVVRCNAHRGDSIVLYTLTTLRELHVTGVVSADVTHDGGDNFIVTDDVGRLWVLRFNTEALGLDGVLDSAAFGLPSTPQAAPVRTITTLDVDGDGDLDLVVPTTGSIYINHAAHASVHNSFAVQVVSGDGAASMPGSLVYVQCVIGCARPWHSTRMVDTGGASAFNAHGGNDVLVAVPFPDALYNVSTNRLDGQFLDYSFDPGLGHVSVSDLRLNWDGVLHIRWHNLVLRQVLTERWDYAAVGSRAGQTPYTRPVAGVLVDILIQVMNEPRGLQPKPDAPCTINGQDVRATFITNYGGNVGSYGFRYITVPGQEDWPWSGLHLDVTLMDSSKLTLHLQQRVVGGTVLEEVSGSAGRIGLGVPSGMCVFDINADGAPDVLVPGSSDSENQAWINNGAGEFTEDAATYGLVGVQTDLTVGCSAGDVNDDGRLDVFLPVFDLQSANRLYINTPSGFVEDAVGRGVAGVGAKTTSAAWADLDGDGDVDLFVCTSSVQYDFLFVNDGTGSFQDRNAAVVGSEGDCIQVLLADLNGNGWVDILLMPHIGGFKLYLGTGPLAFSEQTSSRGLGGFTDLSAFGAAALDLMGRGGLDLVISTDAYPSLLYPYSAEHRDYGPGLAMGAASNSRAVTAFDFMHNGNVGVVLSHTNVGPAAWLQRDSVVIQTASFIGLDPAAASLSAVTIDMDNDGDQDLLLSFPGLVYRNHAAQPDVPSWFKVRPLSPSGSKSAFGAVVRVTCVSCRTPWVRVRTIDGGSGYTSQNDYDAHFGLRDLHATYDVSVTFPGNYQHTPLDNPALRGVAPSALAPANRTIVVVNRPRVALVVTSPTSGVVGVGGTVTVSLVVDGPDVVNMAAAPSGCCWVNGVQTRDTLTQTSASVYTLAYVVGAGDASWAPAQLPVQAVLLNRDGVATYDHTLTSTTSLAGDAELPTVFVVCTPPAVSPHADGRVCVACSGEETACTLWHTVDTSHLAAAPPPVQVPAANMTSATSAELLLGPFGDGEAVTVAVWAVDAAGNVGPNTTVAWVVDLTSPFVSLLSTPVERRGDATSVPDTVISLGCSEPVCRYEYRLNNGPWLDVGGSSGGGSGDNSSSTGGPSPVLETVVVAAPQRVSSETSPTFQVQLVVADPAMQLPGVAELQLMGVFSSEVPVVDGTTAPIQAPVPLLDADYVLLVRGADASGSADSSPIVYEFRVDTAPPRVSVLVTPEAEGEGAWDEPVAVVAASEPGCVYWWRVAPVGAPLAPVAWVSSQQGVVPLAGAVQGGTRYLLQAYAVDAAGLVGPVVNATFVTAPCPAAVPAVVVRDRDTVGSSVRFLEFATAGHVPWDAFQYRVNGGAWTSTHHSWAVLRHLQPGASYVVDVRAGLPPVCGVDVGVAASVSWLEPAEPPAAVVIVSGPPPSTPEVFAPFELRPTRPLTWLEYQLDGATVWTPCASSQLQVGPLAAGDHVLRVRAVDQLGAPSAAPPATHAWTVVSVSYSAVVLVGLPDGAWEVEAVAIDPAGHRQAVPSSFTWTVDTQPPTVAATLLSPAFTASRDVDIGVACGGEEHPCMFCWASDTLPADCSMNATLRVSAPFDGPHTVAIAAVDRVALQSLVPAVVSWVVDATPPDTGLQDAGGVLLPAPAALQPGITHVTPVTDVVLTLTSDSAVSAYVVQVYGSPWPPGSDGLTATAVLALADLVEAPVAVSVAAVDVAGNVDPSPARWTILVDATPPATSLTLATPSPTRFPSLEVLVSGSDAVPGSGVVGVHVTLTPLDPPGDPVSLWAAGGDAAATFDNVTTGVYNVSAAAQDATGNVAPHPAWHVATVDLVPPTSTFVRAAPEYVASPELSLAVAASEPGCTTHARLIPHATGVPGPWVAANVSTGVVALPMPLAGALDVQLRSVDAAGNEERQPYVSTAVVVDRVRPVTEWTTSVVTYTADASVTLCLAVSDASPTTAQATAGGAAASADVVSVTATDVCVAVTAGAADGAVSVRVAVRDAAQNEAVVLAAEWVVDRSPPVAVIASNVSAADGCSEFNGVVVCDAADAAAVTLACDAGGGSTVAVAPCVPQYAVEQLSVGGGGVCGSAPAARRRLVVSDTDFVDAPAGLPLPLPVAADGLYLVWVRSVDAAGNVQDPPVALQWSVDTVPPAAAPSLSAAPPATSTASSAVFVLAAALDSSPGQARLWYNLDGGVDTLVPEVPSPNTELLTLSFPDGTFVPGAHVLRAWSTDQAGLRSPPVIYGWSVVTSAPQVVIQGVPARVSGDSQPSFRFLSTWPNGTAAAPDTAWQAAVEVNLGDGFATVCPSTAATAGVCTWNATLPVPASYTLTVRTVLQGVPGDPAAFGWEYKTCDDAQYAELDPVTAAIVCLPCPDGADCSGGLTSRADLVAQPGFWAPPGSSSLKFYECPVEDACLPGTTRLLPDNTTVVLPARCAPGYTGMLCGVCADGYFEQFGRCAACTTTSPGAATAITLAVTVAYLVAGGLFFKYRRRLPKHQMKVGLTMFQVIASANTAYSIPWPAAFRDFLHLMRLFLIEAVSMTRANCAQPMTYYDGMTATFLAFSVLLAAVLLGPAAVHKWKIMRAARAADRSRPSSGHVRRSAAVAVAAGRPRRRSRRMSVAVAIAAVKSIPWPRIFKNCFLFLFITYPGVSLKVMRIFKCVEVEGTWWLVADMRLQCYEGEWYGYAVYAVLMGCFFTVGMPLSIFLILCKHRHRLDDPVVATNWGFLYTPYGNHAYLWEVEELLRKLWLSSLVVLMPDGSPLQVTSAVLVSAWAHVLHSLYKPWKGGLFASTYPVQHLALGVTTFVFLMGLLFKVDGVDSRSGAYNALSYIMLVLCGVFIVVWLVATSKAFVVQQRLLREALASKAVTSTGSPLSPSARPQTGPPSPPMLQLTPLATAGVTDGSNRMSRVKSWTVRGVPSTGKGSGVLGRGEDTAASSSPTAAVGGGRRTSSRLHQSRAGARPSTVRRTAARQSVLPGELSPLSALASAPASRPDSTTSVSCINPMLAARMSMSSGAAGASTATPRPGGDGV